MYGGYIVKTIANIPAERYEQAVDLTVMRRTVLVGEYLLIHHTKTFLESNLVRYIIETSGASANTVTRLFNQWVEYFIVQALDNIGNDEPLFPNPHVIPTAQNQLVQDANAMLQAERQRGGDQPPRQDIINALEGIVGAVDRAFDRVEQAIAGRQAQDVAVQQEQYEVEGAGQTVGLKRADSMSSESAASQASTNPRGRTVGIILRPTQVRALIRQLYENSDFFQNGQITSAGLVESLRIIGSDIMRVNRPIDITAPAETRNDVMNEAYLRTFAGIARLITILDNYLSDRRANLATVDSEVLGEASLRFVEFISRTIQRLQVLQSRMR